MMDLISFRQQHPEYDDLSDDDLTASLHQKFYSDMKIEDFRSQFQGAKPPTEEEQKARMYEGRARYMREKHPTLTKVRDVATNFVEGYPVIGSYLDEGMAGLGSLITGQSYDDMKGVLDADRKIKDEESTVIGSLPLVGDVTTGGLTRLAGGITTGALAPIAEVTSLGGLAGATINTGVSGLAYGAAHGSGMGNTAEERIGNAIEGGKWGGILGAATPAVAAGVGNAAAYARNRHANAPAPLDQFHPGAVRRVADTIDSDNMTTAAVQREAAALGPEGMIADVGENLRTVTEGIAQQPGPARARISQALDRHGRPAGAVDRVTNTLNQEMGHPVDIEASIAATRQHYQPMTQPFYEQFYQSAIPQDRALDQIIGRVRQLAPNVMTRARNLAIGEGIDPAHMIRLADDPMTPLTGVQRASQGERVWRGQELDYLKRSVDATARDFPPGSPERRNLQNLARDLRNRVDELISPGAPDQSPWAQARAISGEEIGAREAMLDASGHPNGAGIFSRTQDPLETAARMRGMSQMEQDAYAQGARNDFRRIMGRAGTQYGPTGDRNARRALGSQFNRENLEQVAGPQSANNIMARIEAENTFADTSQQVLGNSSTARRQATRDIVPRQYDETWFSNLRGQTIMGAVGDIGGRILNHITNGSLNQRNRQIALDMAEMLVAQGQNRDEIARGLIQYAGNIRNNNAARTEIARIARDIMRGTAAPAIKGGSSE